MVGHIYMNIFFVPFSNIYFKHLEYNIGYMTLDTGRGENAFLSFLSFNTDEYKALVIFYFSGNHGILMTS